MDLLPVIKTLKCSHHRNSVFPPGTDSNVDDSPEQLKYFHEVAQWLLRRYARIQDAETQHRNPNYGKLIEEISSHHGDNSRLLRFRDTDLQHGISEGCRFCHRMSERLADFYEEGGLSTEYFVIFTCDEDHARFLSLKLAEHWSGGSTSQRLLEIYLNMKAYFRAWTPSSAFLPVLRREPELMEHVP